MTVDSAVVDFLNDAVGVAGAFAALFFMQVISHEPQRFVWVQRLALLALALAMFFSGVGGTSIVGGYRPPSICTNISILVLLIVMAVRARFFKNHASP